MDPTEATPQSEADKVRLKRLAKLQQQEAEVRTKKDTDGAAPAQRSTETAHKLSKPISSPAVAAPGSAVPLAGPSKLPFQISVRSASSKSAPSTPARAAETFEEWEDEAICRIFGVTLDREKAEKTSWSLTYLPDIRQELLDEDPSFSGRLSVEIVDRVLIARLSLSPDTMSDDSVLLTVLASLPPRQTVFQYLSGCWTRIGIERTRIMTKRLGPEGEVARRSAALEKTKDLVISYAGLTLQDPSMFPQPQDMNPASLGTPELLAVLLGTGADHAIGDHVWAFIHDLARRFDNDGLEDVLAALLRGIADPHPIISKAWDLGGHEWRPYVRVLGELGEVKPVAAAMTGMETWFPGSIRGGNEIEVLTLLGPVMGLSTFPATAPKIADAYFKNCGERPPADIASARKSLQMTLNSLQLSLYNLFDRIARSGPGPREAVLQFWGKSIALNQKRTAMRVDPKMVCSDGFACNLQAVLLAFAGPFVDANASKIDKVDPLYLRHSRRIDVSEETKVNATKQESDVWYALDESKPRPATNFISEIFFLNAACLRLSLLKVIREFENLWRHVEDMKKEMKRAEEDQSWKGTPAEARMKVALERYKQEISQRESNMAAYEVQMLDPDFLQRLTAFCTFMMTWCVRMVDPVKKHPQVPVELPLPDKCPDSFRMLPEYILEDIIEYFSFVTRFAPQALPRAAADELLTFTLVFATSPYLKNFHLKSKFSEWLYYNTRPIPDNRNGFLGDALNYHPLALKHLMGALMQIYIEVEITGSHTQFYDKFQYRRYISKLFSTVWHNQTHREALQRESRKESFVRFANLLMNDVTYLLDDSLTQLQDVHRLEGLMADTDYWNSLPENERKDEESKLRSHERYCPNQLALANENVHMLKIFTEETPEAFLKPEIVNRLAAMLDYNLDTLAGPKCQQLKVTDAKKYNFQPKILLSDILQVFLNLSSRTQFRAAIVSDGRSYRKELFDRATGIAARTGIKTPEELARLADMIANVEELKKIDEEEDTWDDVPDEFLDPIMSTIMKQPVVLPTSKTTVDLPTIKQHFLSDATDPFNRMPLKIEDVVPDVELKARIDAWLVEKKAAGSVAV